MIRDVSVFEVLDRAAATWPDRLALTYEDREWTYGELRDEALAAAARMHAVGVGAGDHVALWAANLPEWVFLEFGLARLGAVLVTVNTAFARDDLSYLLRHSNASVLVAGREARGNDFLATIRGLDRDALPRLQRIVLLEGGSIEGAIAFADLDDDVAALPTVKVSLDQCINMQYTSGTTGFPKGVMLSSRNVVNNAARTAHHGGYGPDDRTLCQVPLFHCFGCVVAVLSSMVCGASVHLTRVFDPADSLATIRRRGITIVHGVPAMFQALLEADDGAAEPIRTVRTGIMAGAACPPALVRRVVQTWHADELAPGFGLTEASPAVTMTPLDSPLDRRCDAVGVAIDDTELCLVDLATGAAADRGELRVRGEQVMLGYYANEEATAAAITADGWLRTGDIAERDADGRYRIVGRIKEMICRGGENIYPAEVEEAIRGHEAVEDVAVFGVPDERVGETVACAIVPRPGCSIGVDEIVGYLGGRISKPKMPAVVHVVDALPMTASGKIKRFELTKRFGGEPTAS